MAEKEVVEASTVLATIGQTKVEPTFVQRAGLLLAGGVGSLIALVTVGVVIFLYTHYPAMPSPEIFKEAQADSNTILEQYKDLSGVAVQSAQELFQTIVTQALLPVFTAILGYIFAKGGKNDSE